MTMAVRAATVLLSVLLAMTALAAPAQAAYDSTSSTRWTPDGPVRAIAVAAGVVYIGGSFNTMTNASGDKEPVGNVAALDAVTGDLVTSWNATTDAGVHALTVSADRTRVFLGGNFLQVNGQDHKRLAAVSAVDGDLDAGWDAQATGIVNDLLVRQDRVYVGGAFRSLNKDSAGRLGALSATTGVRDLDFRASAKDPINALDTSAGRLVAAGRFDQVNGKPRSQLAAVDLATGKLSSWKPPKICPDCGNVWDLATGGGRVYAGVSGFGGRLVALNPRTGDVLWRVFANGDVQAVSFADGLIYAGGHFGASFGGEPRIDLAAANAATGAVDPDFKPKVFDRFPGIRALVATPGALYAGGEFSGGVGTPGESPFFATFDPF
ncbi:MAG: PQQ-like beta-propeller repeat protein [Actinomycetota bacterium]|nr:PQQ-like beta-propeller repeat protein [Actinomycetota bacterium]